MCRFVSTASVADKSAAYTDKTGVQIHETSIRVVAMARNLQRKRMRQTSTIIRKEHACKTTTKVLKKYQRVGGSLGLSSSKRGKHVDVVIIEFVAVLALHLCHICLSLRS